MQQTPLTENENMEFAFANLFALANRLQALGDKLDDYMTIKQWLLVAVISKSRGQSLTIGQAAQKTGCSHQNVKRMAASLQRQGFLSLCQNPADARSTVLSLTEYCHRFFLQRSGMEEAFLGDVFHGFSSEEMEHLFSSLSKLKGNVERMEAAQKTKFRR